MMKGILAALVIFAACTSAAFAEGGKPLPMAVFGVTVGAPISIQKCATDSGVGTDKECWYRNPYTAKDSVDVATPLGAPLPMWVRRISVQIIDGKVEGVHIYTMGADAQQVALRALVAKYGEPNSLSHNDVQTVGGAVLQSIKAYWQTGNVAILFTGIDDNINNGFVRVVTPKWLAHMREVNSGDGETAM